MPFLIENHSGGAYTTPASDYYNHLGGEIKVDIYGGFGAGQVTFETSPDDGTSWIILDLECDGTPAIFKSPKATIIKPLEFGNLLRANFSGGTATNLNVKVSV